MILQNLLLPKQSESNPEMYARKDGRSVLYDTYWNMFYIGKWMVYTDIKEYLLEIMAIGSFVITLYDTDQEILKKEYNIEEKQTIEIHIPYTGTSKYIYLKWDPQSEDAELISGAYITHDHTKKEVKIAIDICTYKREEYLMRNLKILNYEISNGALRDRCIVYVVDNGNTLDVNRYNSNHIRIIYNINAGGTGGFTRGIIEATSDADKTGITHVLLMDDDIDIDPEALYRTLAVLSYTKDEYNEGVISGAMFRIDNRYIQHMSAVKWEGTDPIIADPDVDMRDKNNIITLCDEYESDYASWWYACYPIELFGDDNMPLPLFLHNDDVEYGIRNRCKIILMPGISVWHDSFENKRASGLSYYDIRNAMILDALYPRRHGRRRMKKYIAKRVIANTLRHRYKDVAETYLAVCDYLKGPDYLMNLDPGEKNKQVVDTGYKYEPIDSMSSKAMIIPSGTWPTKVFRHKRCILSDPDTNKGIYVERSCMQIIKCLGTMVKAMFIYDKHYEHIASDYKRAFEKLSSLSNWMKYLRIQ